MSEFLGGFDDPDWMAGNSYEWDMDPVSILPERRRSAVLEERDAILAKYNANNFYKEKKYRRVATLAFPRFLEIPKNRRCIV